MGVMIMFNVHIKEDSCLMKIGMPIVRKDASISCLLATRP